MFFGREISQIAGSMTSSRGGYDRGLWKRRCACIDTNAPFHTN